jgi:hypothetical protein
VIPYPGKNPRGADRPLTVEDLRAWGAPFEHFAHRDVQLLRSIDRVAGRAVAPRALGALDARLLARFPALGRLCRYTVLTMTRASSPSIP